MLFFTIVGFLLFVLPRLVRVPFSVLSAYILTIAYLFTSILLVMKNLAPHIFRQRLLIEGFYKTQVDQNVIKDFFTKITEALQLRMYGEPIIFSPEGLGKKGNQGYDAFVPLIDSGISLYIWSSQKFLSATIYTCKGFDESIAIEITKNFFEINDIEFESF